MYKATNNHPIRHLSELHKLGSLGKQAQFLFLGISCMIKVKIHIGAQGKQASTDTVRPRCY